MQDLRDVWEGHIWESRSKKWQLEDKGATEGEEEEKESEEESEEEALFKVLNLNSLVFRRSIRCF